MTSFVTVSGCIAVSTNPFAALGQIQMQMFDGGLRDFPFPSLLKYYKIHLHVEATLRCGFVCLLGRGEGGLNIMEGE